MVDHQAKSIIHRISKLSAAINSSGIDSNESSLFKYLLNKEGLLDSFLVLYDECCAENLKKIPTILKFIKKYEAAIHELRQLRVNLSDFEQKKLIGKGHFGVVQVVEEKQTGNVYAMKILQKAEILAQQHIAFFEEERDIMAKATSSWITRLHFAFQDDHNLYLVMDFHPGGDLLSLLDRFDNIFPEKMACFYLAEITLAIQAVHTMGYVHRDLKSENVLIDRCGHIKLADFGSASKIDGSNKVSCDMPVGTPAYLAPEILNAANTPDGDSSYGIECDFWSLGVMAYEMLCGRNPFQDENGQNTAISTYANIINYEKTLNFSDTCTLSETAKEFIKGLLTNAKERLNYNGIVKHNFFLHIDWSNLHMVEPPFLPVVTSVDDTSNFDQFDYHQAYRNIETCQAKATFSGIQLPFIGFTYIRSATTQDALSSISSSQSFISPSPIDTTIEEKGISHLKMELEAKKRELHDVRLKLKNLNPTDQLEKSEWAEMQRRTLIAEKRVTILERECEEMQTEATAHIHTIQKLKESLSNEKSERSKTEAKTLEFLRSVKQKWMQEEEEKIKHFTEKIELYRKAAETLNEHKDALLKQRLEVQQELGQMEAQVLKYKLLLKEKEDEIEMLKKMAQQKTDVVTTEVDFQKMLDKVSAELSKEKQTVRHLSSSLEELKIENTSLKHHFTNHEEEMKEVKRMKESLEKEKDALSKEFVRLQMNNNSLNSQLKQCKDEMLQVQNDNHNLELKLSQDKNKLDQQLEKIQELKNHLDESLLTQNSYLYEQESLKDELKSLKNELQAVSIEKDELASQISNKCNIKVKELESLLGSFKQIRILVGKRHILETDKCLIKQFQCDFENLIEKVQLSQDSSASEMERLSVPENDVNKLEADLSNIKVELASSQKDLRLSQERVKFLREKAQKTKDIMNKREVEMQQSELKLAELKDILKHKNHEFDILKDREKEIALGYENMKSKLTEQEKTSEECQKKIDELNSRIAILQHEADKSKIEKMELQCKWNFSAKQADEYNCTIQNLQTKNRECEIVIENLKKICSEQDDQLASISKFEEKIEDNLRKNQSLTNEIQRLNFELKMQKSLLKEEKSLQLCNEKRVKDLESKLLVIDQEKDICKTNSQKEIQALSGEIGKLEEEVFKLKGEISQSSQKEKSLEHCCFELKSEVQVLKKEIDSHIHHIHSLKDSNFKLTDALEEAITKGEAYKLRITEVERGMLELKSVFHDKELRLKSTSDQQTKLIDFLQTKLQKQQPRKKAVLSRIWDGRHVNDNGPYMTNHYRKIEEALVREKAYSSQLATQLSEAHGELSRLKAQGIQKQNVLQDVTNSPDVHFNVPEMHKREEITHRWQTFLVMRAGQCYGCLGSIPFSQNAVKCQVCNIMVHTKCSKNLQNPCGLHERLALHNNTSKNTTYPNCADKQRGWLKISRSGKLQWERRFAILDNHKLILYDQEFSPSLKPIKAFDLNNVKHKIVILHSFPMSELPNISPSDYPYLLKIDWKDRSQTDVPFLPLYIMAPSLEEKQLWLSALESIVFQGIDMRHNEENDPARGVLKVDALIPLNGVASIDVNTVVFLDNGIALIGAEEGLFSFHKNADKKLSLCACIEGVNSVYDILLIESVGVAVFIAGTENYIYHINLDLLKVAAKATKMANPSIDLAVIEPYLNYHLISTNHQTKKTFLCAAASNRISIFSWNFVSHTFEVCRQFSTQEPSSCCQFTPNSLIVGAEQFYKINLKTFAIEEFLDESDTSLDYAIHGSGQMSSFPVAIIQISEFGRHEEYLLIFYEFGVFVDAAGRRSREVDLKFIQLPIQIVFCSPYLYVVHHNAVEVLEIQPESFTKIHGLSSIHDSDCAPAARSACRMLEKPRFIGKCFNSYGVLFARGTANHVDIISLNADFPSLPESSFTNSLSNSIQNQSALDIGEMSSLSGELSSLSNCSESSKSSFKRTLFPNFMRASKRTKDADKIADAKKH